MLFVLLQWSGPISPVSITTCGGSAPPDSLASGLISTVSFIGSLFTVRCTDATLPSPPLVTTFPAASGLTLLVLITCLLELMSHLEYTLQLC